MSSVDGYGGWISCCSSTSLKGCEGSLCLHCPSVVVKQHCSFSEQTTAAPLYWKVNSHWNFELQWSTHQEYDGITDASSSWAVSSHLALNSKCTRHEALGYICREGWKGEIAVMAPCHSGSALTVSTCTPAQQRWWRGRCVPRAQLTIWFWGGIGLWRQEDQGASANAITFWRAASCHMAPRPSVWKVSGAKFQTQVVWISLKFSVKLSHFLIGKDNLWSMGILKINHIAPVSMTNYAVIILERFTSINLAKHSLTISCAY